jgi:aspartyl-tRNA(Asn)/glutamyl-tRNA(Gln) amidotransferase subunit C
MKVDGELVRHIAQLSRLSLSQAEVVYFEEQLTSILDYVDLLESMPDELGPSWRHDTLGSSTPERLDSVEPSIDIQKVLESAPAFSGSSFKVPRILD